MLLWVAPVALLPSGHRPTAPHRLPHAPQHITSCPRAPALLTGRSLYSQQASFSYKHNIFLGMYVHRSSTSVFFAFCLTTSILVVKKYPPSTSKQQAIDLGTFDLTKRIWKSYFCDTLEINQTHSFFLLFVSPVHRTALHHQQTLGYPLKVHNASKHENSMIVPHHFSLTVDALMPGCGGFLCG